MQKPVLIVGEAWGEEEARRGKPFVGPSGGLLYGLLSQVGIAREDCYVTNVFNLRPPGNQLEALCGPKTEGIENYRALVKNKYVLKKYQPELDRLWAEINRTRPNLIIALGNTALWALCKKNGIKKYRGSPLTTFDGRYKVLPTWHPAAILRQWELRVVTLADLHKAKEEMGFAEVRRPERYIYMEPELADLWAFYGQFLRDQSFISADIETKDKTITEVGLATADGLHCLVVPFWDRDNISGNYWPTLEDEREAWAFVRHVMTEHPCIGQNFSYDMQYFWRTVRIPCPHFIGDTMLLHHALQPEMEKSLGFLGSIYTNEPSWKFMRTDHSTLKLGDD